MKEGEMTMTNRPWRVVAAWGVLAVVVLALAPNLTRMASESFGILLPDDAESMAAARLIRHAWPDRSQGSVAVVVLSRPSGLTKADEQFAAALAARFEAARKEAAAPSSAPAATAAAPGGIIRVLGPASDPEVAARLVSDDRTTQLVVATLDADWVAPRADELVRTLKAAAQGVAVPAGLAVTWSGDAAVGSAYMDAVHHTLDVALVVVVVLLFIILLIVYRSLFLALVPLATIGISLLIARGLVAWTAHWTGVDPNPLVELFLIAVLFGTGTDLVLLLTWRFAEHWDGQSDPAPTVAQTVRHEAVAIVSSAGTLILALSLLVLARFKLFSQTGPFVALGMVVGLLAALSLAPALLVLLARYRPRSFAGFRHPPSGFWPAVGRRVLARPVLGWLAGVALLGVPALQALRVETTYDMVGELPANTPALAGMKTIVEKFGPSDVSPLEIVVESNSDWRDSEGLYLIDELTRTLSHHKDFGEIRSATQPLGSRETLKAARIESRLTAIRAGLGKIRDGAELMVKSFIQEGARLRMLLGMGRFTGIKLPGLPVTPEVKPPTAKTGSGARSDAADASPTDTMLEKIGKAAEGAKQIADGSALAAKELGVVIEGPVGADVLDRVLLTRENIEQHPELGRAFAEYISADGKTARIVVGTTSRLHSRESLDDADELLQRADDFDDDYRSRYLRLRLTGPNVAMADVRRITNEDIHWAYIMLPLGIFLAMLFLLRDFGIALNLVATMLLTYGFTIGATNQIFSWLTGSEGLDWKVKFFTFVVLLACGVDYNIFLVSRMRDEVRAHGLRAGIAYAVGHTGALITSAAAITICSYLAFLVSPLHSLRSLGAAVGLGIAIDAMVVRTLIMPCGHWLMFHAYETLGRHHAPPPLSP
jgi:RND superfamily putative drug exporter